MTTEPKPVWIDFRETTSDTACKIIGAIAADKPHVKAMITNVSAMIDEQISQEFKNLLAYLRRDYPELANDLQNNPQFVSAHALRRYAYKGTPNLD